MTALLERGLVTEDEAKRISGSIKLDGDLYIVEIPARMHEQTTTANQRENGHVLLYTAETPDGWVRSTYRLNRSTS